VKRPLDELLNRDEHAWPLVLGWLEAARNLAEVLPTDRARGEATLVALQVTTRSPLGAVALECAGISFDRGWVRLLGAGSERLRGLAGWNGLDGTLPEPRLEGAVVVAHDAVGGFFAWNVGEVLGKGRNVFYGAPDTLEWLDTGRGYAEFVQWLAQGDLATFYTDVRWPGWEGDVAALPADKGVLVAPPLFTKEGQQARFDRARRRAVPMHELWGLWHDFRAQLGLSGASRPRGAP
jgi:hypothetical protein